MPSHKHSNASFTRKAARPGDDEQDEAFRFISAVIGLMDSRWLAVFRANLSKHAGTQNLLALVDDHVRQRGVWTQPPNEV